MRAAIRGQIAGVEYGELRGFGNDDTNDGRYDSGGIDGDSRIRGYNRRSTLWAEVS